MGGRGARPRVWGSVPYLGGLDEAEGEREKQRFLVAPVTQPYPQCSFIHIAQKVDSRVMAVSNGVCT